MKFNQALCAILFLYKSVLHSEIEWVNNIKWAKRPKKLPVVFSQSEIAGIMAHLKDVYWVIVNVMKKGAGAVISPADM